MSVTTADVVVAGAGHNSLITAAYVALSGREVVVLDARAVPGGGAASEELMEPGWVLDSCSTGHTLIQTNPLLTRDELGLLEDGLEYLVPDPFAHVAFPDGEHLTAWMDRERTREELARFSRADAAAYGRLLDDFDEVKHLFAADAFTPVGFGPSLDERLREHPRGTTWRRRAALSALEVVRHDFEDPHVQAFLLWQAFQTLVPVDQPGTGALASSIVFGRQRRSWTLPRGGSGRLTDALVRVIERCGGTVLCGRRVHRLVLEDGRCRGVEAETGETFLARDAVVSTIHVKHLVEMAPADAWDEGFRFGVETFDVGVPCAAVHLAASAPPVFAAPLGPRTAVSAGLAGWPEQLVGTCRDLRDGRWVEDPAWVLVATPTLADPSRAPAGRHTVKLLAPQSHGFAARRAEHVARLRARVQAVCPAFGDEVVLGELAKMPEDIEAANEHMIRGTYHGGDRTLPQSGALRPVPGWASHRMPIPGLYQTGGTTHPGGSITGGPGRNAAWVLLHDLGTTLEEVVDGARRPRAGSR